MARRARCQWRLRLRIPVRHRLGPWLHGWLQHEPTVLRTAIHAHDLRSLTCRYFSGRLPTADGVPSRFRQHPNTL